ncbi:hypothetical protein [Subdoligranulum variabile]|uniref:hypothetical protein n=1 Tax=Subdoligranulum variabile TaxID=214851 RepID=UPI0001966EFB|nr:hypothetical protein [Subdoligranulum variabile]UWP67914.1 hypothetical protein NQ490_13385 [Subdoligranulum variabile]
MAKFVWSMDPLVISRLGKDSSKSPLTSADLRALGIPARKIPRVQAELARLNAGNDVSVEALPELARQIARQLC